MFCLSLPPPVEPSHPESCSAEAEVEAKAEAVEDPNLLPRAERWWRASDSEMKTEAEAMEAGVLEANVLRPGLDACVSSGERSERVSGCGRCCSCAASSAEVGALNLVPLLLSAA